MKNILIFVLFFCIVLSQGGGGGGRGGRSRTHRGSGSTKEFIRPKSGCSSRQQCFERRDSCDETCYLNNQKESLELEQCIAECQIQFGQKRVRNYLYLLGITIVAAICVFILRQNPKQNHQKFIKNHKEKIQMHECCVAELQNKFEDIKKRWFSLTFFQNSRPYTTESFKIEGQKHQQKYLFKINMKSEDLFGFWTANGFISSSTQGLKIWFLKYYDDKRAAKQIGKWSTIIYQGLYDDGTGGFKGKWRFKGFDSNPAYSGQWQSLPLKKQ